MTFNPELIAKARKGEIAILNDGSVEELQSLLKEAWPLDTVTPEGIQKYYLRLNDEKWDGRNYTDLNCHSIKDFFMNTTDGKGFESKDLSSVPVMQVQQPRTYRVTRQQMKEIWKNHPDAPDLILQIAGAWFGAFDDEVNVGDVQLSDLLDCYNQPYPEILRQIFPAYFYIPEGEPVLVRETEAYNWMIAISDGNGRAYTHFNTPESVFKWSQIIPLTKNPPK